MGHNVVHGLGHNTVCAMDCGTVYGFGHHMVCGLGYGTVYGMGHGTADGHELYCRMCGNGGDIFWCDEVDPVTKEACPYSFCAECIQQCFGASEVRGSGYYTGYFYGRYVRIYERTYVLYP